MQSEYLYLLSEPVQQFILDVEKDTGVGIQVIPDRGLNEGGPNNEGNLAIIIKDRYIHLFAPTNGYFPDGVVRHEVLHVQRFHVEGVPKLVLSNNEEWDKSYSDGLGALDNAVEHVVIVPVELRFHPERRQHWEAVMQEVCSHLQNIPEGELRIAVCLHWTFLRHVLPNSPSVEVVRNFAMDHELLEMADQFADRFIAVLASKEEMIRLISHTFPEIPLSRGALEYINSRSGTCQKAIH